MEFLQFLPQKWLWAFSDRVGSAGGGWLHRGSTGGYLGRNHDHGGGMMGPLATKAGMYREEEEGRKEGEAGCRTNRFILKRIDTIFQAKLGKRFLYSPNTM